MLDNQQSLIRPSIKFLVAHFFHCPKEHNAYYRPLVASFNDEIENDLLMATGDCSDLSSGALTNVAGRILMPSRVPTGVCGMVGGWDRGRFAFFIEAEVSRGGAVYREAYQGFTDHLGVTGTGNSQYVDRGMRLTINNRSILRVTRGDLNGNQVLPSKLINQLAKTEITDLNSFETFSARDSMKPDDVLAASSSQLSAHQSDFDSRTMITSVTKAADSADLAANTYLSKTFNSYKKAFEQRENEWDDEATTLSNARGYATKIDNSGAAVLSTIQNAVGFEQDSTFTWGELISTFPEVDDIAKFVLPKNGILEDATMMTEEMSGSNDEVNVAFNLGHLLPNLLFQASFGSVDLVVTNRNLDGLTHAVCMDATPLYKTNVDFSYRRQRLLDRLENELLHLLLNVDTSVFTIKIKSSLINGSIIRVTLNDKERTYRVPNYCTSISSPFMSASNELNNLAEKLQGTFETIRTRSVGQSLF